MRKLWKPITAASGLSITTHPMKSWSGHMACRSRKCGNSKWKCISSCVTQDIRGRNGKSDIQHRDLRVWQRGTNSQFFCARHAYRISLKINMKLSLSTMLRHDLVSVRCMNKLKKKPSSKNCFFMRIPSAHKQCKNSAQGINMAAVMANGEFLVIIPDPNVLLSYNVLHAILQQKGNRHTIISGKGTDIKISPHGMTKEEYAEDSAHQMALENSRLLQQMGWPKDPAELTLIPGTWRRPGPHNGFDVYLAAVHHNVFEPYDETINAWGTYHNDWVRRMTERSGKYCRLKDVTIIHQFHRVWKNEAAL
jgi:hypothetical protein